MGPRALPTPWSNFLLALMQARPTRVCTTRRRPSAVLPGVLGVTFCPEAVIYQHLPALFQAPGCTNLEPHTRLLAL